MRNAFTLVELVVVVLILGILAAVAAPGLLSYSDTAVDNGLRQTLTTVRDAIDKYRAETGDWPGQDLLDTTLKADLAPYLRGAFPSSPVGAKNSGVLIVALSVPLTADIVPLHGWKYSSATGEFIVNDSSPLASDPGTNYDEL